VSDARARGVEILQAFSVLNKRTQQVLFRQWCLIVELQTGRRDFPPNELKLTSEGLQAVLAASRELEETLALLGVGYGPAPSAKVM
jgi:hypothetical protein